MYKEINVKQEQANDMTSCNDVAFSMLEFFSTLAFGISHHQFKSRKLEVDEP